MHHELKWLFLEDDRKWLFLAMFFFGGVLLGDIYILQLKLGLANNPTMDCWHSLLRYLFITELSNMQ